MYLSQIKSKNTIKFGLWTVAFASVFIFGFAMLQSLNAQTQDVNDLSSTDTDLPPIIIDEGVKKSDIFLKIDGIEGESKDAAHRNEIVIDSFQWGEKNSGGGKVVMEDLRVTMKISKASPKLMKAVASGEHFSSAVLTVRKAGGERVDYFKIELTNVMVTSYQVSGSAGQDRPVESITLNFEKIKMEYKEQKEDGSFDEPVIEGWDLKKNKGI